jgi:iron-sulfur cluster repair protein YtfE (RIC family)
MTPQTVPLHDSNGALTMLHADHQRVRDLFQRYEDSRDPHLRQQLAAQVCVALELHALLEETVFYPAVADATEQVWETLAADACEDHQRVRQLMMHLRVCDPTDGQFDTYVHDLMDEVSQHMQKEEQTVLSHLSEEMQALQQATTGTS